MARGTRETLRSKIESAILAQTKTLKALQDMHKIYDPDYPEHMEYIEHHAAATINLQEQMKWFRDNKL